MTREEIIRGLIDIDTNQPWEVDILKSAISALEQEPCEDAISREALLKKQYRIDDSATLSTRDVVNVEDIEDAPSVTQKSGKWSHDGSHWKNRFICSECGYKLFDEQTNYCPNCGAKMESEE